MSDRVGYGDDQTYVSLLDRVIGDGIAAATADYADDLSKREGSVAGFEACRDKTPEQLATLLRTARDETWRRYRADMDPENYWWARCYELEVEWTCNVISAALMNSGLPVIVPPTARGVMKAAEVLGVADA